MSWSANKNQRCCGTCAHWGGPRTVNSAGDRVTCEGSSNPHGKCYLNPTRGGFCYGPSADWCCGSDYSKWSALK